MALCIFLICVLQTVAAGISGALSGAAPRSARHPAPGQPRLPAAAVLSGPHPEHSRASSAWRARTGSAAIARRRQARLQELLPELRHRRRALPRDAPGDRGAAGPDPGPYGRPARRRDRQELVDKFGWKIGDTFQLTSIIPPYQIGKPFDFVVRAIYTLDQSPRQGPRRLGVDDRGEGVGDPVQATRRRRRAPGRSARASLRSGFAERAPRTGGRRGTRPSASTSAGSNQRPRRWGASA